MSAIKRFFNDSKFERVKKDLSFLVKAINGSNGELDFQIRPDDKFNLYYKGNSLAEVSVQKSKYKIRVNEKFGLIEALEKVVNIHPEVGKENEYDRVYATSKDVHRYLQQKVLTSMKAKIKEVNNGEEISFEQSLMTDNLYRPEFIIIDRQVSGGGIPGTLDLLAIKNTSGTNYSLVVIEVKLGNNDELSGAVAKQVDKYVVAIQTNISAFEDCYERNYFQKKSLGLYPDYFPESIKINGHVDGMIVVGAYSKIAEGAIGKLKRDNPGLKYEIKQFCNYL